MGKNLPEMQAFQVLFLDGEDPLEEDMATHSGILAWRIPMDRGYSPRDRKELDTTERPTHTARYKTTNKVLLRGTSKNTQYLVITYDRKESGKEYRCMYTYVVNLCLSMYNWSLCYALETNRTLYINYASIKNKWINTLENKDTIRLLVNEASRE